MKPAQKSKSESKMDKKPQYEDPAYVPSKKLAGKVAVISGGDSGIGRATALLFAKEGADIAVLYLDEHKDAKDTQKLVEGAGQRCVTYAVDLSKKDNCEQAVQKIQKNLGRIDILVNNAAMQKPTKDIKAITEKQLTKTFETNIFSYVYLTQATLPQLKKGSCIINTTSVTAYRGSAHLLDYSATKGAIVSFTRSLALMLGKKEIRVNAVAPGPVWTPLIPSTFPEKEVKKFGEDTLMQRPAQPYEIAYSFLFLASQMSSYMSGQVLHPNGGEIINT